MTASFDRLLEVQEQDTHIDQLRHRRATLPERAEVAALERQLAELETRIAPVRAERVEHGARQEALEEQIEAARARKAQLETRMRQSASTRELQAMDEEVRHLARHVGDLEDRDLELMELIEPLEITLKEADGLRNGFELRAGELRTAIAAAEAEIDATVNEELARRVELAAEVPEPLLGRYEALRAKLGGTGAARLVGGSCTGCHLALPAMEVDRIKKAPEDAVITCDNCGRILVR